MQTLTLVPQLRWLKMSDPAGTPENPNEQASDTEGDGENHIPEESEPEE